MTTSRRSSLKFFPLLGLILFIHGTLSAQDHSELPTDIVVAALHFSHGSNGYEIELTDAVLISSYKPLLRDDIRSFAQGDALCQILDRDGTILDSLVVKKPLQIRYEYPTDDQTIGSALIQLQENSVMIRFRYISSMKYLRLLTLDADRQPEFSTILALPEMHH